MDERAWKYEQSGNGTAEGEPSRQLFGWIPTRGQCELWNLTHTAEPREGKRITLRLRRLLIPI